MAGSLENRSPFNNEIKFCKVYTQKAKQELERVFLRHRISYFVEWGQETIWQKIFPSRDGHIHCTICINKADFAEARELAHGIRDVRVRNMAGMMDHDAVKDLKLKKEIKESIEQKKTNQPVIRKTSGGVRMDDDYHASERHSLHTASGVRKKRDYSREYTKRSSSRSNSGRSASEQNARRSGRKR